MSRNTHIVPPVAGRHPHSIMLHGDIIVDDYFWLQDRSNPEVIAYLEAENNYTEQVMRHTNDLQARLFAEMRARIQEENSSVPLHRDNYYYYARIDRGKQYPVYCRKQGHLDADEVVLIDQNQLAARHSFCRLGALEVSPDQHLLAYSVDFAGHNIYELFLKDLRTGVLLEDRISHIAKIKWANDGQTLFYTVFDSAHRPSRLYRHRIGSSLSDDELVYEEHDEAFHLSISKTRSQKFLLLKLHTTGATEVWFLPANIPEAEPQLIQTRQPGLEYKVEHRGDAFLIVTNDRAENFRLVTAPVTHPSMKYWQELIPHRRTVLLEDVDAFADYLVLYEREQGLKRIRILNSAMEQIGDVAFPEPIYTFQPGPNEEYATDMLRFTYMSRITPKSIVDYDMSRGTWHLRKQYQPAGFDARSYRTERVWATAPDGVQVPISLVYPSNLVRDGRHPLLLYGYGALGIPFEPVFDAKQLSLLDRGFVIGLAHIRGGSELGRSWYEQGKLLHKKTSLTDFIACAEHLIAEGYTSRRGLAIHGGCAGGLLVTAVSNMRPDLFAAVVARVPFTNLITAMNDPAYPSRGINLGHWGNPTNEVEYRYMKTYSPYDNLTAQTYPHMLVTAGLNDLQVPYWNAAKWTAKLRALQIGGGRLLLKTYMTAGHRATTGRYDYLKDIAFEYAFLLDVLEPLCEPVTGYTDMPEEHA